MKPNLATLVLLVLLSACNSSKDGTNTYMNGQPVVDADGNLISGLADRSDLMKAIVQGNVTAVRRTIQLGANVNENVSGQEDAPITPLIAAVVLGNDQIAHELMLAGASPSIRYKGHRILDFALSKKSKFDPSTLKMLSGGGK
jgi:hypothetical protein